MAKIISVNQISDVIHEYIHKKIVVAGGCFDILHIGHVTLLENAKKEGDALFVLLESDEAIKKRKGVNRPIHSQQQRASIVGALSVVDVVVLLSDNMTDNQYDNLLQKIRPSVIATTEEDAHIAHKERQAQLVGAQLKKVNKYVPSVSTTKLLQVLSEEL